MRLKLLGHSANDLFWFILPLVLPFLLVRYSLNYTQAGGILTIYLAITAVGSFVMGKLSDRFSPRRILGFGFILASLGLASSGFAPSLAIFLLLISITAVGVSTFHPVMYAIIDMTYTEKKGKILGLYESFGTSAILIMFLLNGFLFKWIGIRGVMIITALPGLIMGLIYLLTPAIPTLVKKAANSTSVPTRTDAEKKDIHRFVFFLLSIILRVMSVTAILNFLPTIFVHYFSFDGATAAFGTAFFFAGGIFGSLTAGKLSERFNSFAILLIGSLLIALSLLILNLNLPKFMYPIMVALFGFLGSGCIINQNLLMTRLGGRLGKGEVFGILMGVMTITSSISPALFGMVIDTAGFHTAFTVFSLPVVLSAVILLFLLKSYKIVIKNVSKDEVGEADVPSNGDGGQFDQG